MRLEVLPRECRARSPHVKARINMEVDVTELGRLGGLARAAGMTLSIFSGTWMSKPSATTIGRK